jgi:hypothetical protein
MGIRLNRPWGYGRPPLLSIAFFPLKDNTILLLLLSLFVKSRFFNIFPFFWGSSINLVNLAVVFPPNNRFGRAQIDRRRPGKSTVYRSWRERKREREKKRMTRRHQLDAVGCSLSLPSLYSTPAGTREWWLCNAEEEELLLFLFARGERNKIRFSSQHVPADPRRNLSVDCGSQRTDSSAPAWFF